MEVIKEILFWWMLIYDITVITIKPIRKNHIDFLKSLDKWYNKSFYFLRKNSKGKSTNNSYYPIY